MLISVDKIVINKTSYIANLFVKYKLCHYFFPHYNIPGIGSFIKEVVEAAGFELRNFQF